MKPSKYNFFFPYEYEDGKYIAYNALSNSMALMDEKSYKKYAAFKEAGTPMDEEALVENLKKGNFLIADDLNEVDIIRHDMYAARFDTRALGLTIAVTSDCNFRCIYCYEKDVIHNCYMDEKTEKNIADFVERQAKTLRVLSITWYGGEPLMNTGTIERLSKIFIEVCKRNGIRYHAGIITNGYNLTRENLELLKRCQVSSIQITIDGDEATHDKRRPLQNGMPTFGRIMRNLTELKDDLIPVHLRINVDRENCGNLEGILHEIKDRGLTSKVTPYVARVENNGSTYEEGKCLSINEYLVHRDEFGSRIRECGYETNSNHQYPKRKNSYCSCDRINSYVIGPDGTLYKCWENIGNQDSSIGNINETSFKSKNSVYLAYMMFDPTLDAECSVCKYLPICIGGCPRKRQIDKAQICDEAKYQFERRLKNVARKIQHSKSEAEEFLKEGGGICGVFGFERCELRAGKLRRRMRKV